MKHRHIVQVVCTYETTATPRHFGILLSPVGDEDLSHFLERTSENDFPQEDLVRLRRWAVCLTSAVAYIHSKNIRHKDIKPSNIICKDDEVYLTDFGSAHQFSAGLTNSTEDFAVGVTKMYSAPEVIAFDRRGRSADIYSLGCVFAEIFTVSGNRRIEDFHDFRSEPDPDQPDKPILFYHATANKVEAWFSMEDDPWPFRLISRMMAVDREARPTAEELLKTLSEISKPEKCNCHVVRAAHSNAKNGPSAFEDDESVIPSYKIPPQSSLNQAIKVDENANTMIRIQSRQSSNGSDLLLSTPPATQPKKQFRPSKADIFGRNAAAIAQGESMPVVPDRGTYVPAVPRASSRDPFPSLSPFSGRTPSATYVRKGVAGIEEQPL